MINISINDLPYIPYVSGSFRIIPRPLVFSVRDQGLRVGGKDIQCRTNPETFELEGLIDGKWCGIEPMLQSIKNPVVK